MWDVHCAFTVMHQAYSTSLFTVTEFETARYVTLCKTLYVCVFKLCLSFCSMSKWAESSGKHVPTVSTFIINSHTGKVLHVRITCALHRV